MVPDESEELLLDPVEPCMSYDQEGRADNTQPVLTRFAKPASRGRVCGPSPSSISRNDILCPRRRSVAALWLVASKQAIWGSLVDTKPGF